MKGVSLWKGNKKTKDFFFQDRIVKEFVNRSGTACMVHKYIGPYKQDPSDSSLFMPQNEEVINELTIQDVLLGEVRDRKYSDDIIEMRGTYIVNDTTFDLSQFGPMVLNDSIVLEFHINDSIEKLGRRLMTGDVIELVHLRDETSLDSTAGEIKKYFVIHDANQSAAGYGPTWYSHIWRVRCSAIVDTQEYRDILHKKRDDFDETDWLTEFADFGESDSGVAYNDSNVQSVASFKTQEQEIRNAHARSEVDKRSFDSRHFYIKAKDEQAKTGLINWIFNSENYPENFGGDVIYSGDEFPEDPEDGDYFVRTDYVPERLFKRVGPVWRKVSDMWRREWVPAHRILESFINNSNVTSVGIHEDQTFDERQALSKVVLPKTKDKPEVVPVPKKK